MNILILVGGPTACGKSTFVKKLSMTLEESKIYRRVQGFFDIGHMRGIDNKDIFDKVTSEDVDDRFVKYCEDNKVVISDVHYAVQMNRNELIQKENDDINENYLPTISKDLLTKLDLANIVVVAVWLECNPETCYKRAIQRFEKSEKVLRTKSIEDAQLESFSEKKSWLEILKNNNVSGIILDSQYMSPTEMAKICYAQIQSIKETNNCMILSKKMECK